MAQDKFKSVAATFQIFKDGEAVSARKLDGIIRKTQDGSEKIQRSLGDMGNFGLAFSGLQLFHNSIARALGPADAVTIAPLRVFDTPQSLSSQAQGLVRYPYSTASAADAGNRSQNLLPILPQTDKVGVGCVNDDGDTCVARFDEIYDQEKNILDNGLFGSQLASWETSGVIFDGDFARLDTVHRYNTLTYSEDFLQWTNLSGLLTTRAADSPTGGSNAQMFNPLQDGVNLVNLELDGSVIEQSSTDWCFSVWMSTSGSQISTFLEIDGATHVRGTQGRGAVGPAGDIYSVEVSGRDWNRFYVYGTFDAARTSGVARIHIGRGNVTKETDKLFIWGAQLEPTTGPSAYQATSGVATSGHIGETFIGQTFPVIPRKWYQISIDWEQISGTTWSLVNQNGIVLSESTDATITETFQAPEGPDARFVGFRDINIHIHVSGSPAETGPMKLKTFRVDPGTPCHALNCPGFTGYGKTRRYRATLPTITESNHQYFGEQLQFPDEVNLATNPELPANIMGVFDHEQNHAVPNRLVDWRLADWPIGQISSASVLSDPQFLTDWTTAGGLTYPSEFSPIAGSTSLTRDNNSSEITSVQGFTGNATEAIIQLPSGTDTWTGENLGMTDGDGNPNIFGRITGTYRFRFRFKPFSWLQGNSKDGNGFGLFTSNVSGALGGGFDGTDADAATQIIGIDDDGFLYYSSDTFATVRATTSPINYGEWNDIEFVISGSQTDSIGPHILGYVNGNFVLSGLENDADWGGGDDEADADNWYWANSRDGGDSLRGFIAGWSIDASGMINWQRYAGKKELGKSIVPFPSIGPYFLVSDVAKSTISGFAPFVSWPANEDEDSTSTSILDTRASGSVADRYNPVVKNTGWARLDRRSTTDLGFIALEQMGRASWMGNSFQRTMAEDIIEKGWGRNHWRLQNVITDANALSVGFFEAVIQLQSGFANTDDIIFVRRNIPGSVSGVPITNYEFGVNTSGGPYLTIAGFNETHTGTSPVGPDGYEAAYWGNSPSGNNVTFSGNWFHNANDIRDGNVHHCLFRLDKVSATPQFDWRCQLYVDGIFIASGTFIGPDQNAVDWTEWDETAGGGDRGYYDWSQEVWPDISGAMVFECMTANSVSVVGSGRLYQFGFHEGTAFPWEFSSSGFGDFTRRIPFPMPTATTVDPFIFTPLDEGFGGSISTISDRGAQAWVETGETHPIPYWDIAYHVSGRSAIYSDFDEYGQEEYVPVENEAGLEIWIDAIDAFTETGVDGDNISLWEDKSGNDRDFIFFDEITQVPILRFNEQWGKPVARMDNSNDWHLALFNTLQITGTYTVAIVYRIRDSSLTRFFGNRGTVGPDNDGMTGPGATTGGTYQVFYDADGGNILGIDTDGHDVDGDLVVAIIRRDAADDHYLMHQGRDFTSNPPLNVGTRLNIAGLFTLDSDSKSDAGMEIASLIIYSKYLDDEDAMKLHNYLAKRYRCGGRTTEADAALRWFRTDEISTVNTSGTLIDSLTICSATSGQYNGIEKSFNIEKGTIATWQYHVKGTHAYPAVKEVYELLSGTAQIDPELTQTFINLSGVNNPYTNIYQISGATIPGDDEFWAEFVNGGWDITRRIKALDDNTWVRLAVGIQSNSLDEVCLTLGSFDVVSQTASSSRFAYCADAILGLNWDGRGDYVREENLFQFSNNLLLWQSSGLTITVDTDDGSTVRMQGALGTISQSISGIDLLDDKMTLQWKSRSSTPTSGLVTFTQGLVVQNYDWAISSDTTSGIVMASGIDHETGANLEVKWTLYGDEAILSRPQLVHGSGTVSYIGTLAEPVKKYRRVILPVSPQTLDATWASGYALVEGGIIQTTQDSGPIDPDGLAWNVNDTRGFPGQGVFRIAGQEYGYRIKTATQFGDTLVGWRGTTFNPPLVTSGARVTNVAIPQSMTKIDPITKEITFRDIIPAPLGDWANSINLQLYNTHISNLDRFSLQASAVSVTQATGNLLTAFVQHVGDHRRHFRLSQLCGQIIDSSSWCASPVIVALAEVVDGTVEELTEQAQLNIEAKRFVPASNKEIIISWGDGEQTVITGVGTRFTRNTHTYDLRQIAEPLTYTIQVVVKDLDLDFSRRVSTQIIVRPKVNPAGESTKSTIQAGSKMLLPGSATMTASAKIKDKNTSTTTASAMMVIP